MIAVQNPTIEAERLRALRDYGVLDTPPEAVFDDMAAMAARICGAPIAMISFVDQDRQWWKARLGLTESETPRASSFCGSAITQSGDLLVVPDAARDDRFSRHPLVTGKSRIRFYAGSILRTPAGYAIGTLCVMDRESRSLHAHQLEGLRVLGRQVISQLELRRALAAATASEERYRLVFRQHPIPLFVFDCETLRYLAVNDAAVARYGYSEKEFLNMTLLDIQPEADHAALKREVVKPVHGLISVGRWRHQRKDGSVIPVEIHAHNTLFDGRQARIVIAIDITEQEQALAAFRSSEERFRALSESAPIGIFECDVEGQTTYCNSALLAIADRPLEQTLGSGWIDAIHPDDRAAVLAETRRCLPAGLMSNLEHRVLRRDGTTRWVHMLASPQQRDAQGRVNSFVGTIEDITEKRISEVAMLESEERYRKLLLLSPDAHFVHVDNRVTLVNQAFCRLLGASSAAQLIGRSLFEIVHPDYHDRARERRQLVLEGHPVPAMEQKFVRLDGSAVEVEATAAAVAVDFEGRTEVQVIAREITSRKAAEASLRDSEERYRRLLTLSPDAQYVNVDGVITLVNPALCKMLGAERPEQLLGKSVFDIVHPDYHHHVRERRGLVLSGQPLPPIERKYVRLDGTSVDVEVNAVAFDFRGRTEVQVIARDITARKVAEAALRDSEERFKLVARAVSDVIWDWNLLTKTVWRSASYETIFGLSSSGPNMTRDAWLARIHAVDRDRVMNGLRYSLANGKETWVEEYRFLRRDGSYAVVQDRGQIMRDATGKAVRMVGGMSDLSERKKLEQQYLRAQRMESIGTLAGGIAHDLNNVLAPILMSIDLLKLSATHDPKQMKLLDTIQASTHRGADLVRQVLTFARGLDGQRVAVNLRHLFRDLERIIGDTFPRKIRILSDAAVDVWPVLGDPTQIHQVLINLAVNARDAMHESGTLALSATNVTLDAQFVAASPDAKVGPHVVLSVSDTGTGIVPEIRDRIFEPFFTTKEVGKGTGLGLATVHAIVKGHGGFVSVHSEVGLGTTFRVYLPADPGLRPAPLAPSTVKPARGGGELVLVVDDEASIRQITQQTLEAFGYRVRTANDGAEAVSIFSKHPNEIALVLTDMMMPVMDGAATIQVLRRLDPTVKIIAASGLNANENVAKAASLGVTDFLAKPYTTETMLEMFRKVLERPAGPATR
jgi:PAS domain S-box-containing protein